MKQDNLKRIPLEPRDALFGGRTCTVHLNYKAKENEHIEYYDFTSLYSFVQKKNKSPLGHPTIYIEDECKDVDISNFIGLIKCTILLPKSVFSCFTHAD